MIGEAERAAENLRQEQREAALVFNRLRELHDNPISGQFDAAHLKAIHAYSFQDLPQHQPGVMRADTPNWTKRRGLEGRPDRYDVPYVSHDVEGHIADVLDRFGGPETLKGLTPEVAGARLAGLYGDLDHGHGFYEGNSRTLREFTRELAAKAGFDLDWNKAGVGERERNELYLARDLAIYEREFPGLTEERAMQTNDRREYEAYFTVERLRVAVGERTLEAIISEGLTMSQQLEQQQGVGKEADAPRDFRGLGNAIEAGLDSFADKAESAIHALADGFAELFGGGHSVPELRTPEQDAPMTASERREARIRMRQDMEQQQRAPVMQEFAHSLGATEAYSIDELQREESTQRDRSGGRGY